MDILNTLKVINAIIQIINSIVIMVYIVFKAYEFITTFTDEDFKIKKFLTEVAVMTFIYISTSIHFIL